MNQLSRRQLFYFHLKNHPFTPWGVYPGVSTRTGGEGGGVLWLVHILLPLRLGCGCLLGHATHGLTANENGVRKCGYIECSQLEKDGSRSYIY